MSIDSFWPEIDFAASVARTYCEREMSYVSTIILIDCTSIRLFPDSLYPDWRRMLMSLEYLLDGHANCAG